MNIIMSGSGSGGHIYPCIALYKELIKTDNVRIIIFKQIDKKIYDMNKIPYIFINDSMSTKNKFKELKKVYEVFNPKVSVTFGGKNSLFINLMNRKYKIRCYAFEQNAILGKANKLNYLLIHKLFTNFKLNLKKEVNVGNPNAYNINVYKKKLFNNHKITLLFTMGSQGSSSVNEVIEEYIEKNVHYNILYVCGKNVKCKLTNSINVKIFDYYNNLSELINISDIIISRAGASTLAEIITLEKPSIIIPSPYVPNNHQYKNAKLLSKNNGCILLNEKELNCNSLETCIHKLAQNQELYFQIKKGLNQMKTGNNFDLIKKYIYGNLS